MASKRKRTTRNLAQRVTAKAIAAFTAGDSVTLHREMRLPPWQLSPLDTEDGPCPYAVRTAGANTWADSVALRKELEHAQ